MAGFLAVRAEIENYDGRARRDGFGEQTGEGAGAAVISNFSRSG